MCTVQLKQDLTNIHLISPWGSHMVFVFLLCFPLNTNKVLIFLLKYFAKYLYLHFAPLHHDERTSDPVVLMQKQQGYADLDRGNLMPLFWVDSTE